MNGTDLGCMFLGGGVVTTPLFLPINHGTGGSNLPELGPSQGRLTDTSFRAGESPILRHQVGAVALVELHLRHQPSPLPLPHHGLQENPEANVFTVR